MSVPPLEAPILKRMAEPRAGSTMAKHSSSIGWSVKGWSMGKKRSIAERATERRILQYAVLAAKPFPRMIRPINTGLCNKYSETCDAAESKVVCKFEKISPGGDEECAESQHEKILKSAFHISLLFFCPHVAEKTFSVRKTGGFRPSKNKQKCKKYHLSEL